MSAEADIYPRYAPALADKIEGALGEGSDFHCMYGFYAQGVGPETAILPRGWKERLWKVQNGNTNSFIGWCLDVDDLFMSKAAAARPKDQAFCVGLLRRGHVKLEAMLALATTMPLGPSEIKRIVARKKRWAKSIYSSIRAMEPDPSRKLHVLLRDGARPHRSARFQCPPPIPRRHESELPIRLR